MKKTLLTLLPVLLISLSVQVYAQEDETPQYLFSSGNIHISGFGGPIVELTAINEQFAVFVGGGGGVLFNQTFFLGGYGEGLTTKHYMYNLKDRVGIDEPRISFGHGGLWLGYIHKYTKAVHAGLSTKLGWGQVALYDEYYTADHMDYKASDNVFVVIPQFEVELNLTSWFKLNVSAGYRVVTGLDKTYINSQGDRVNYYDSGKISSPEASITLLFGGFRK